MSERLCPSCFVMVEPSEGAEKHCPYCFTIFESPSPPKSPQAQTSSEQKMIIGTESDDKPTQEEGLLSTSDPNLFADSDAETIISMTKKLPKGNHFVDSGLLENIFHAGNFFGRYQILEKIAQGGMGMVFKVYHPILQQKLALKVMLAGQGVSQDQVARFHIEAKASSKVRHPHIVSVHDVGEINGLHYLTMDFIEGKDLASAIHEEEFSPREAVLLVRKICQALVHAHSENILHRDLKPGNILIDLSGEPYVTDFGLAKDITASDDLTVEGTIVGTPAYMPPEQALGETRQIGAHSDVYSLGAIFYELLTKKLPLQGNSQFELFQKIIHLDPINPRRYRPEIPKDVDTICMKCLEKSPAKRYQYMKDLLEDLDNFLAGRTINARKATLFEGVWKIIRRNKLVSSTTLFFILFIVCVLYWGFLLSKRKIELAKIETLFKEVQLLERDGISELEIEKKLQKRAKHNPKIPEIYIELGQFLFHRERYQEAIDTLQKAIRLKKELSYAHYFLNQAYQFLGKTKLAEKHLSLILSPVMEWDERGIYQRNQQKTKLLQAYFLAAQGKETEALKLYNELINQVSNDLEARKNRATLLIQQKKYLPAKEDLDYILLRHPFWITCRFLRAKVLISQQPPDIIAAKKDLLFVINQVSPQIPKIWIALIQCYQLEDNIPKAEKTLSEALEHLPKNPLLLKKVEELTALKKK